MKSLVLSFVFASIALTSAYTAPYTYPPWPVHFSAIPPSAGVGPSETQVPSVLFSGSGFPTNGFPASGLGSPILEKSAFGVSSGSLGHGPLPNIYMPQQYSLSTLGSSHLIPNWSPNSLPVPSSFSSDLGSSFVGSSLSSGFSSSHLGSPLSLGSSSVLPTVPSSSMPILKK